MSTTANNLRVSDDLLARLAATAALQGRTVDELAEESLREFLRKETRDQSWQALLARGQRRGSGSGVSEDQVPDVVREYRSEHRER